METLDAKVTEVGGHHFIVIDAGSSDIQIPLSDDKPTEVKRAFNQLIVLLKSGPLSIRLAETGDDLFSQVAQEYLKQLNAELREVRSQMEQYALVTKETSTR
jgi:hypothetical protein